MDQLKAILEEITSSWTTATNENFTNHPLAQKFRNQFQTIIKDAIQAKYPNFIVKASVGAGNWANVPWLSILDPEVTTTTQDGIYPVYLFKADGTGFYLSLNQGTTKPERTLGREAAIDLLVQRKNRILSNVPGLAGWGLDTIQLNASTDLGKSYESPNISAKYYDALKIPDDDLLLRDLFAILDFYLTAKDIYKRENLVEDLRPDSINSKISLPKPFILLAGISGTGKSRFVRHQALRPELFCSVAVRPDWHEPSDLLGYISRLNGKPEYHATDVLSFFVKAWVNACDLSGTTDRELANKRPNNMETYWLCLDEMNLAPVEQYFADYLSVIETREWIGDKYICAPLLKAESFACLEPDELARLRKVFGIESTEYDSMWNYFIKIGIPIPPNLIVAGTVNMDETTHGFSRKVIDRALTFDFGKFFPNDFDQYFNQKVKIKSFSFSNLSCVTKDDLSTLKFDNNGEETIKFCKALNKKLKDSPFELAFRALNELLILLVCINPQDKSQLQAVWDDFLMTKVLPRIEGDTDKLSVIGQDESILEALSSFLDETFSEIKTERIDFFREADDGTPVTIACRSIAKIKWMQDRLNKATFTSFWP